MSVINLKNNCKEPLYLIKIWKSTYESEATMEWHPLSDVCDFIDKVLAKQLFKVEIEKFVINEDSETRKLDDFEIAYLENYCKLNIKRR